MKLLPGALVLFTFAHFASEASAHGGVTRFCTPGAAGSVITAAGSASFAVNGGSGDLVLHASSVPAQSFGLFFYGSAQIAPTPLGSGSRCVGGTLLRLPVVQSQVGQPTVAFRLDYLAPQSAAGPIAPGSTWNFQFLFRSGATFDLSDAIGIHFGAPEPLAPFTTLAQGTRTGHPLGWSFEGGVEIVSDSAAWNAFWAVHSHAPQPTVDFTQQDVVAVFAGRRFSTGYTITVKRLGLSIATLGVTTLEMTPGNCGVGFAETQPWHFALVPRVEHLVSGAWTKTTQANFCP